MPTVIDSLFLQLGIDTSKFSADQKKALAKIAQFESQTKKSAEKSAKQVNTVGRAFRDIADDTSIGASAKRLDVMSTKLRAIGQAGRVSGGVSGGLGMMAEGLGALLSPATLAVAAIGLLGKAAWDFNSKMTATNATIFRQSQLSGINARKLWAWGQAAKAVGGTSTEIPSFMEGLSTRLAGGFTGFGNPGQLLAGMALMGIPYRPGQTVNPASLIEGYRNYAKARGGGTFGWDAARAMAMQTGLYDPSLFKFALPGGGGLRAYEHAKGLAPKSFNATLASSIESQRLLGYKDIGEAVIAERTYGAIQHPMQTLVYLFGQMLASVDKLLTVTIKIADWIGAIAEHFGIKALATAKSVLHGAEKGWKKGGFFGAVHGAAQGYESAANASAGRKMMPVVRAFMAQGLSRRDAEALAGNFMQESSLNPNARNGSHFGLAQWSTARQALARQNGFNLGTEAGQIGFTMWELHHTAYGKQAMAHMKAAKTLQGKTLALDKFFERSGELSFNPKTGKYGILGAQNVRPVFNRVNYAHDVAAAMSGAHGRMASELHAAANMHLNMMRAVAEAKAHQRAIQHITTHHTKIDAVNVSTQATDAEGMARGARKALSTHPLIGPTAQHQVTLSTHGMAG